MILDPFRFEPPATEPASPEPFRFGQPLPGQDPPEPFREEPWPPCSAESAADAAPGEMTGVFGGACAAQPARAVGKSAVRKRTVRARGVLSGLPELWGVDLALLLLTLLGAAAIAVHWSAILSAIAGVIFRLVRAALAIVFLAAFVVGLYLLLRRRRRYYY